jgi:hypothetical protein
VHMPRMEISYELVHASFDDVPMGRSL